MRMKVWDHPYVISFIKYPVPWAIFTSRDERLMVGAQEKQLIVEANRVDESSPKILF